MHCQVPANIRIYLTSFWAMTKYSPRGSSSSSSKRSARYTFNRRISPSILGNCAFKNVFLSDSNFGSFIFFWASVCSLVRLQGSRVRKSWVSINRFVQHHILPWHKKGHPRAASQRRRYPDRSVLPKNLPIKSLGVDHQGSLQSYKSSVSVIHGCLVVACCLIIVVLLCIFLGEMRRVSPSKSDEERGIEAFKQRLSREDPP